MSTTIRTTYTCSHRVSQHAVSQFRERYGHSEVGHLEDWAVRNSIDRRVCEVIKESGLPEPVFEMIDGVPTAQHLLLLEEKPEVYALLRRNEAGPNSSRGPDGGYQYVVVTVLTGEMVQKAMGSGRWRRTPEAFQRSAIATPLASKLASIQLPEPALASETVLQFAAALAMVRKQAGLSQSALAEHLGCSELSIFNWEAGKGVSKVYYDLLCQRFPALRDAERPIIRTGAVGRPKVERSSVPVTEEPASISPVTPEPELAKSGESAQRRILGRPRRTDQLSLLRSVKASAAFDDFLALLESAPDMTARELAEVLR